MDLPHLFKNTFLYHSSYKQQSFNEILVTAGEEKITESPPSFRRCFISKSDKSLFSPASPPGPAGTSKRMHFKRIIKMDLKRKNKNQKKQPRTVEGKFRQHTAHNTFGCTKQEIQISSKEPIWLILLVSSHPFTWVINNKRHRLRYFIT